MMNTRINVISPSATLAMDSRAKELRSKGMDIISFAAGEPDFPTPKYILDAASRAVNLTEMHKYSPAAGLVDLRDAIAIDSNKTTDSTIDGANTLVANGAKQAIFLALAAIIEPGDEVLVPVPYWTTYPELIKFFGGIPIRVQSDGDSLNFPSLDDLRACITDKTKLLIWCSPSNPTGLVADSKLLREVLDWSMRRNIWLLSDEIYRRLYYCDDHIAPTLRSAGGLSYEKLVVIDGVSKSYSMTGWRVGWIIGSKDFINQAVKLQSHMTSNVNNVAQHAAMAALSGPQTDAEIMLNAFSDRRQLILDGLRGVPGIEVTIPEGAFYVFPKISKLCAACGFSSSQEFALCLLEKVGIATVPGEAFGVEGFLRFSYALSDGHIKTGIERLKNFVASC